MATLTPPLRRDEPLTELSWTQPGGLGIVERRSWATWQLVAAALAAVMVGMLIGYSGKKPAKGSGDAKPLISLGAVGAAATTVTTQLQPAAPAAPSAQSSPTTVPGTQSPTTAAPLATATTAPLSLLMANTVGTGPSTLPAFTAGSSWNVGWAFDCVRAPGGAAMFTISVVSDAAATRQAVTQTSRNGQGITPQTISGRQHLQVSTDPACRWAIKVTGAVG